MCPKQTLIYFLKELISSSISYTRQRVPQKTLKTMTKNQNCHSLQLKVCSLHKDIIRKSDGYRIIAYNEK